MLDARLTILLSNANDGARHSPQILACFGLIKPEADGVKTVPYDGIILF